MAVRVFGEYFVPCAGAYLCQNTQGNRFEDVLARAANGALQSGAVVVRDSATNGLIGVAGAAAIGVLLF